jgi:D-lactate dehydrogenase (cytochrome)
MKRIIISDQTDERNSDYLKDFSQLLGTADEIVICHSSDDVIQILDECSEKNIKMTIQGAMTGICGGAVPDGGCVVNMSEMNGITGMAYYDADNEFHIKVQPGLTLKELNDGILSRSMNTALWSSTDAEAYDKFCSSTKKYFPPDPTETLASIGGMVACDASGACSFKYGSTRKFVEGIKIVTLQSGCASEQCDDQTRVRAKEVHIKRGQYKYEDINNIFGNTSGLLPGLNHKNSELKDVAGIYYDNEMDLIDLFIGCEGLFGVITEIELKLTEAPEIKMGLMLFLGKNHKIVELVNWLRNEIVPLPISTVRLKPVAIEYFDKNTLDTLNRFRDSKRDIGVLPEIDDIHQGGIYLEFHLDDEELLEDLMTQIFDSLSYFGINQEEQWLALEPSDFERLKKFRHAVPECVNILIADQKAIEPEINKVGTDMAVPGIYLKDVLNMYQNDITDRNLKAIIFGHIGDNHLHVNLIPEDLGTLKSSLDLVMSWADQIIAWRGTVTAEHGIGKQKKELFKRMMSQHDLDSMDLLKKIIEPRGLINQGTLLD